MEVYLNKAMGQIELYEKLYGDTIVKQPIVTKSPEEVFEAFPLIEDAKPITLAEYDRNTKEILTAHRMKDYRRKTFKLVLLPEVSVLFDLLLEGSDYWNGLLHNESPYT